MKKDQNIALFNQKTVRRHWDGDKELWYFSIVDVIGVLTDQADHKKAQSYWTTLKNRLKQEGSEIVTNCDQLKMQAFDLQKGYTKEWINQRSKSIGVLE